MALSSPPGGSARAVVRLSGERAWDLAAALLDPPPSHHAHRTACSLTLPGWPAAPTTALAFRRPKSYTGEDLVELWVPGAPPLVRRLLLTLQARGARLAERGEFTRRAFLAGRLDLTQVEAVLALTTSEDAQQARAALRALSGGVSTRVDDAKHTLADVLAHVEAAIDFSEEELDLASDAALAARLDAARDRLAALRRSSSSTPAAGTEPVVALRGPANAGKSTLFNALVGGDAIVSNQAGTTRDVIAAPWRLPTGRVVRLLDTAGDLTGNTIPPVGEGLAPSRALATPNPPVGEGLAPSRAPTSCDDLDAAAHHAAGAAAETADLILQVHEPGTPAPDPAPNAIRVTTKADLDAGGTGLRVSAHTGQGLSDLAAAVAAALGQRATATDLYGSARQDELLRAAETALERAATLLRGDEPARAELGAIELTEALDALGRLTGAVSTDEVLGRIFASFCIGK